MIAIVIFNFVYSFKNASKVKSSENMLELLSPKMKTDK